jgi:hypothetical protein
MLVVIKQTSLFEEHRDEVLERRRKSGEIELYIVLELLMAVRQFAVRRCCVFLVSVAANERVKRIHPGRVEFLGARA